MWAMMQKLRMRFKSAELKVQGAKLVKTLLLLHLQLLIMFTRFAHLVKFSHTVFALPFALIGFAYALYEKGAFPLFDFQFSILLLQMLLCMVTARNAAMGFNRWADRKIDARNPRTARREIPAGVISPRSALWFVVACSAAFIGVAFWINNLCGYLSPVALLILLGYSYTKRFSALSHYILGIAQAIAPVGVYLAVVGRMGYDLSSLYPLILGAVVMAWMAGFDILYALQDVEFDRKEKLYSLPARTSPKTATAISILTHLLSLYGVILLGQLYGGGLFYWIGVAIFASVLLVQHILYTPKRAARIGATFTLVNGIASTAYALFTILDMLM